MEYLQREAELAVEELGVGDVKRAGREPGRQEEAPPEQLQEIVLAAEDERAVASVDRQRHADPGGPDCRKLWRQWARHAWLPPSRATSSPAAAGSRSGYRGG